MAEEIKIAPLINLDEIEPSYDEEIIICLLYTSDAADE